MSGRQYLARLITVRYLIALASIALFLTASFLIVRYGLQLEREGYYTVGLAAEQRVASQRIPFLASAYVNEPEEAMRRMWRSSLSNTVTKMADRHEILTLRAGTAHIPAGMRSILRSIYYGEGGSFDRQVRGFIACAQTLLDAGEGYLRSDMPELIRLELAGSGYVLQTHGLLSRLLRQEAVTALDRIYELERVLWLLTLALLAAEVPLIFLPMTQRAARSFELTEEARLRAEREVLAAQAAHEGQASFIRTMSHELRTPLNAILGMNQLLRMGIAQGKVAEYTADIDRAGRHLLSLIDDILEFSRLEAKQITIQKGRTSLAEEMERTFALLHPLAERKGLRLEYRLDPELAGHYRADGLRIRQVLVNIAGNAVKFTDSGSIVMCVLLAGAAGESTDLVRFEVQDTGIGVPPEAYERIFEEFQQADTSLARRYGGSGLGLAISSRLVDLMGGEIGVESCGKGSLFWFTLPLERDRDPLGTDTEHAAPDGAVAGPAG